MNSMGWRWCWAFFGFTFVWKYSRFIFLSPCSLSTMHTFLALLPNLSHKLFAYFRVIGNTMFPGTVGVFHSVVLCMCCAFKGVKVQIYFYETFSVPRVSRSIPEYPSILGSVLPLLMSSSAA